MNLIKQKQMAVQFEKNNNLVNGYVQNRQQQRLEVLYRAAKILDATPRDLLKEEESND